MGLKPFGILLFFAACGSARADTLSTIQLPPLSFFGVNGNISQTDTFQVLSTAFVGILVDQANPYDESPRCPAGSGCITDASASYTFLGQTGFFGDTFNCPALAPSCIESGPFVHPITFNTATLSPGFYNVGFQIVSGGSASAQPTTLLVGLDLVVMSGSISPTITVTSAPEPSTLLMMALIIPLWHCVRRRIHRGTIAIQDSGRECVAELLAVKQVRPLAYAGEPGLRS